MRRTTTLAASTASRLLLLAALLGTLAGCSADSKSSSKESSRLKVESLVFVAPDDTKTATIRARPGDTVKTEMKVSGFTKDESGKSVGETAMWLKNADNKIVFQDKTGVPFSDPFVEGGTVSLAPTLKIPTSAAPGDYTMTATVTDKTANRQTGQPLTITVE